MEHDELVPGFYAPVHRALTEPILLGGAPRAVDDRHRARCATQQDRFGQRAMDRGVKAGNGLSVFHQTSAPPPN